MSSGAAGGATAGAVLLRAEAVHKAYAMGRTSVSVLKGAHLEVTEGSSVAIVGASGAGKSTLLNVLGGLDHPDRGHVHFAGEDIYAMSGGARTRQRAQSIGFVFQSYHLLPELDVIENVMLPARALGRRHPHPSPRALAAELLTAVGLGERLAHRPLELSGGEQQRAALARALMNQPRLVLADEPTGNLDDRTGGRVLDYLFSLVKSRGTTLVMVTHSRTSAARCDRVLHLTDGVVVGS